MSDIWSLVRWSLATVPGTVGLGEEATVGKRHTPDADPPLSFAREDFLRDGVTVIVRQHMRLADPVQREQFRAEIGRSAVTSHRVSTA